MTLKQFRPFLFLCVQFIFVVIGASGTITAAVAVEPSKEDKLKAAYLLNFTRFIEWPEDHGTQTSPVRICLQDRTPFEEFFTSLVADRDSHGNKSKIKVHQLSDAAQCDLTYLHHPRKKIDPDINYGLVVLASADIEEAEAAIVFFISNRRLRFEINTVQVAEEEAVFSSELLKLARIK